VSDVGCRTEDDQQVHTDSARGEQRREPWAR